MISVSDSVSGEILFGRLLLFVSMSKGKDSHSQPTDPRCFLHTTMPESRADGGWRRIVMKLSFVCYKITQLHLNLLQDCPVFLAESANSDIIRLSTPEPDSDPDEDSAAAHWHRLVRARRGDSSSAADCANPPAPLPSSPQQGHQDPRDLCIHERTSRMGSNQFASMVRCKDCGATLEFSVKRSESNQDNSDSD